MGPCVAGPACCAFLCFGQPSIITKLQTSGHALLPCSIALRKLGYAGDYLGYFSNAVVNCLNSCKVLNKKVFHASK